MEDLKQYMINSREIIDEIKRLHYMMGILIEEESQITPDEVLDPQDDE